MTSPSKQKSPSPSWILDPLAPPRLDHSICKITVLDVLDDDNNALDDLEAYQIRR
jgi:hypothetical protein